MECLHADFDKGGMVLSWLQEYLAVHAQNVVIQDEETGQTNAFTGGLPSWSGAPRKCTSPSPLYSVYVTSKWHLLRL